MSLREVSLNWEDSPEKYLGYFPLKNINDALNYKNILIMRRKLSFIKELTKKTNLPLTSYFLENEDIKKVLSHRV